MKNEPNAMREIHKIREDIYEETKNMSQEERAALTRKEAREIIEKYGLEVRRSVRYSSRKAI